MFMSLFSEAMASGDGESPGGNGSLPANFDTGYLNGFMQRKNSGGSEYSMPGSTDEPASPNIDDEFRFTELYHPAQVLTGLNHLRNSLQFCDVVILAGGQEFNCHRIVLASFSPYFNAMFTGNLAESTQNRVTINDIEASVMELIINYGYTSEVVINRQNVQALLSASNLLEILPVKEACCQFLEQNMDETNCIGIHCFAEAHACTELQQRSKKYTLKNYTTVNLQDEFLQLPKDKLTEFLKDDSLNVESEESVFKSVLRWLDYSVETRKGDFERVLEHVRLPLMSPYFLFDVVEKHEVIAGSQRY